MKKIKTIIYYARGILFALAIIVVSGIFGQAVCDPFPDNQKGMIGGLMGSFFSLLMISPAIKRK